MSNSLRTTMLIASACLLATSPAARAQCPVELIHSPKLWHDASFGRSVQIKGDVAVVADSSDHTFCPLFTCSSGAVHVFRRSMTGWGFEATIFHSRISESDIFGGAISLDGPRRFAASAPGEDLVEPDTGAVYIFEHDGEAWREVAEVAPVEPIWISGFGSSLALLGDTLVVGQPRHNVAYIYREIDGRWEFVQKLVPPDPRLGARFSNELAMNDDWLMVGAPRDDELGHLAGAVYIYRREPGGWYEFVRKLAGPTEPFARIFGAGIGLDGDRMAIGASTADGALVAQGAVYIFELMAGEWRHIASLQHDDAREQDALGASVALQGDTVVAGAPHHWIPGVSYGAAYVFRRQPGGDWRQAAKLLPSEPSVDFGRSIDTDGAGVIVGAPADTVGGAPSTGAAYLYDLGCILCPADLDGDGELTFFDFLAFQNLFAAGDMTADFDDSGALDFFDFLAFQNAFAAGCA